MAQSLRFVILLLLVPVAFACSGRSQGVALAEDDQPRCVIFFEGADCDPVKSRSSCCTEAGVDMAGCWTND